MNVYQQKKLAVALSPFLLKTGIDKLFSRLYGGIGHILMLHRVLPQRDGLRINNHHSLEISPAQLEEIIRYFQQKQYDFVSMNEVYRRLKEKRTQKRFIAFTFDDGYVDNYQVAFPIFKKYGIPFAIYVSTAYPDHQAILWWYLLEDLLIKSDWITYEFKGDQYRYTTKTADEKEAAFYVLREVFNDSSRDYISRFFQSRDMDPLSIVRNLSMSWDQIREINDHPLGTVGAHTINHPALKNLNREKAYSEIIGSKEIIEEKLGTVIEHFSYPFGSQKEAGNREFNMIKKLAFKTATTTRLANLFDVHSQHLEALPRITVNAMTDINILALQLSGFFPAIRNRFRRHVTL